MTSRTRKWTAQARQPLRREGVGVFAWPAVFCAIILLSSCGGGGSSSTPTPTPTPTITLRQAATPHGIVVSAAADSSHLSETNYANVLGSEFSGLEPENEMKFDAVEQTQGIFTYTGPDQLVAFAQAHSMSVRGHTLVWHQALPAWVTSGGFSIAQLNDILQTHIANEVGHYATKVYAWDVVNEAFNDDGTVRSTIWYDQPGIGFAGQGTKYIEQALDWAHTADPNAKLFYNDYGAEMINAKSNAIYAMAQDFKTRGVPLDGIGFQFHIDLSFDNSTTLTSVASNFKRFADLGMQVHITELDIALNSSTASAFNSQAKLYGELATICAQQPACTLFQTWGFTDKYSWIPAFRPGWGWALLWDAIYQKKPAYTSVVNAWK
ncbi:MAG: endo-1,4-beta-xylanase [Deltaproteobacteria bacterium]